MTTIAADFRTLTMVSDSKTTHGDSWFPATKIYRINDELIGIAGACVDEQKWMKWHCEGRTKPIPKLDSFAALILRKTGLFVVDATGVEMLIERGFHATGSGGTAALAVMLAGHPAKKAVEIACQIDASSGGDICVQRLK